MSAHRCPRSWQIEAVRDGRLPASMIEAHHRRCESCLGEARSLNEVGARLRQNAVDRPDDDLAMRRLRGRVLAAADAERLAPPRPEGRRFVGVALAALVFAIAAACTVFVVRRSPTLPGPEAQTRVRTTDEGGAHFSSREEASAWRIDLTSGTLALAIDRRAGGKAVVVHVPDGEIEDTGTKFQVSVASGVTTRVSVDEGSVVVRLREQAPVILHAGERWERAERLAPAMSETPDAGSASTPAPAVPARRATPRAGEVPARLPNANVDHRDRALDSRDEGHDEDRAYLEVVRLLREGRSVDARAAARDYARRFPKGFRRSEIDGVLEAP